MDLKPIGEVWRTEGLSRLHKAVLTTDAPPNDAVAMQASWTLGYYTALRDVHNTGSAEELVQLLLTRRPELEAKLVELQQSMLRDVLVAIGKGATLRPLGGN